MKRQKCLLSLVLRPDNFAARPLIDGVFDNVAVPVADIRHCASNVDGMTIQYQYRKSGFVPANP